MIHQANSGGPAAPCNRALDRATGRYVFFLGADDYLGREALRAHGGGGRRYDSDVMLGRVVGVNSRYIHQDDLRRQPRPRSACSTRALPWSLANTKLFRRELIERHRLRYPRGHAGGQRPALHHRGVLAGPADLGAGRLRLLLRRAPAQRRQHHLPEPAR